MTRDRRKHARIFFEETIRVETAEWTDSMATGLDISLNGTRFHCENSLAEGEIVTIVLTEDLQLQGEVRWCWPIEWYYQTAIEFLNLDDENTNHLREYITRVTGEEYTDQEVEDVEHEEEEEELIEYNPEDLYEEEEFLEEDDFIEKEDHSSEEYGRLTPIAFAGQQIVIIDHHDSRAQALAKYLVDRNQFEVKIFNSVIELETSLVNDSTNLIILSWEPQESSQKGIAEILADIPFNGAVIILSGPMSLEDRLHCLNSGAFDCITRPTHLSSISQSILQCFHSMAKTGA